MAVFASLGGLSSYAVWTIFNKYRREGFNDDDSDDEEDEAPPQGAAPSGRATITGTGAGAGAGADAGAKSPSKAAGGGSKLTQRKPKRT